MFGLGTEDNPGFPGMQQASVLDRRPRAPRSQRLLTAATRGGAILASHGIRGGKAMIATLRHWLISVSGRLIRHGRQLILRLPPCQHLLAEILARLRALPAIS